MSEDCNVIKQNITTVVLHCQCMDTDFTEKNKVKMWAVGEYTILSDEEANELVKKHCCEKASP